MCCKPSDSIVFDEGVFAFDLCPPGIDVLYMMDIMMINQTISTMMIWVILIFTLVCMALLGRIIMSCIIICMDRMTVGCIVYLRVMSVWCPIGVEM